MASKKFLVDIDLRNNQLTNASLQNLTVHPATGGKQPGWIYFNTTDNTTWVWTGAAWLDLGKFYTHATPGALNPNLSGANVLATLVTNAEGHVLSATTRTLTLGDLGYNPYVHPPYTPVNLALAANEVMATLVTDNIGSVTSATKKVLTPAMIGAAPAAHTHVLADITNVTATAAEVNTLHLTTGVVGQVLAADSANTFSWRKLKGSEITNDLNWCVINDGVTNTINTWSSDKIQTELNNITNVISGGVINKGGYDVANDVPSLDDGTPIAGIKNGWMYTATSDGLFFTEQLRVGDSIIANKDNPLVLADWTLVQKNVDLATTAAPGIVQLATNAEALTGIDGNKAITPATLDYVFDFRTPSESVTGAPMVATTAEVTTGTNDAKMITPLKLAQAFAARLPIQATESTMGIAELATQAETDAGTDDLRIVTPLKLKVYVAAKIAAIPAVADADEVTRGKVEIATQAEVNAGTLDSPYAVTPLKLKTLLDNRVGGYAQDIGDGAATSIAVTHNLNTKDVSVTIYENSTGEDMEAQVVRTSVNVVTISFNVAPTAAQYRVVIKK